MGDGFDFLNILIFALIAGFLVYRLRSVLGRRHGEERSRPNPWPIPTETTAPADNVVILSERGVVRETKEPEDEPYSLASGLARIKSADPDFDEKHFLTGARHAFEIIVAAYAHGDTAGMRHLLSDEVYDNFAVAIRDRVAAGETHETRIERVDDVDIIDARLEGRTGFVTVKFVTIQMNVTRDASGAVLDGDPVKTIEITDIWTFARNTRSRDPNWLLVETRTSN